MLGGGYLLVPVGWDSPAITSLWSWAPGGRKAHRDQIKSSSRNTCHAASKASTSSIPNTEKSLMSVRKA